MAMNHPGCIPDWREIRYAGSVKLWVCDNCGAVRKSRPRVGKISQHPEDMAPEPTTDASKKELTQMAMNHPEPDLTQEQLEDHGQAQLDSPAAMKVIEEATNKAICQGLDTLGDILEHMGDAFNVTDPNQPRNAEPKLLSIKMATWCWSISDHIRNGIKLWDAHGWPHHSIDPLLEKTEEMTPREIAFWLPPNSDCSACGEPDGLEANNTCGACGHSIDNRIHFFIHRDGAELTACDKGREAVNYTTTIPTRTTCEDCKANKSINWSLSIAHRGPEARPFA